MIHFNRSHDASPPASSLLIDEACSGADARDILRALVDSSINFYKLRNLSSQIRKHENDDTARQRIEELELARSDVGALLANARREGRRVRVRATFDLVIEEDTSASSDHSTRFSAV